MKLRLLLLAAAPALALLSPQLSAQNSAPFCVVTGYGAPQCFYYDAKSCGDAARSMGGLCAANPSTMQPAVSQPSTRINITEQMDSVRRAGEEGRRVGEERAEHQARMKLLRAQTAAAAAQAQPAATAAHVTYRCPDGHGSAYETHDLPIVGCTVTSVTF